MTSEAKIAANRRNARRSTGPRTTAGKLRVRRNALRHGLAAIVVWDPAVTAEVERVAAGICSADVDPLEREQALIVAEVQITLKQTRRARAHIVEHLSQPRAIRAQDARDAVPEWLADGKARSLDQLWRLERYERDALSRRKRAAALAVLRGPGNMG
jgi:hypothetical protein